MKAVLFMASILILCAALVHAQDYAGSTACDQCHSAYYDTWHNSGHHWKLNEVGIGPVIYPFSSVPNPPEPYEWSEISYIIGGYYWKARFMDQGGYIVTGDSTYPNVQYNLLTETWTTYHLGEVLPYNCGVCHTTGYDTTGHQNNMAGIVGTWHEDGIGCEACHGPGSDHVAAPSSSNISVDPSAALCGECHYRDTQLRIPYSNGFIQHHEQYEELYHSPHRELNCVNCHDPHKSTVYDQGGLLENFACTDCHTERNYLVQGMEALECWDCHMPYAAKSATSFNTWKADLHSHIFNVITDPIPRDSVIYQDGNAWYMELDGDDNAQLTLDWACQSCHTGMTLLEAHEYADNIHVNHPSAVQEVVGRALPSDFAIAGAYPNPFNPNTIVEFSLDQPEIVKANIYDVKGRLVVSPFVGSLAAGVHQLGIEGSGLPSGIYFLTLRAGSRNQSIKLALMK